MGILEKAITFAVERHTGMVRKGTDVPYIVHPIEAVSIAASITSDAEILAAAVLHDVVEDTPTTIEEIREIFGSRVANLVASDSEDKMPGVSPSESWKARKEATVQSLQSESLDEKIIVLADKLSNIRASYRDFLELGDTVWERFNQKDKQMQGWYYRAIADAVHELLSSVAYQEYCRIIGLLFDDDQP